MNYYIIQIRTTWGMSTSMHGFDRWKLVLYVHEEVNMKQKLTVSFFFWSIIIKNKYDRNKIAALAKLREKYFGNISRLRNLNNIVISESLHSKKMNAFWFWYEYWYYMKNLCHAISNISHFYFNMENKNKCYSASRYIFEHDELPYA